MNAQQRMRRLKLSILAFAGLFFLLTMAFLEDSGTRVEASSSGPTPGVSGAPGETNCTACHFTSPVNSGGGFVKVLGLPRNYRPGQQIPITVSTEMAGGVIFGFQLTSLDGRDLQAGTFSVPSQTPAQLQTVTGIVGGNQRRYVQHTGDGVIPTEFDRKSWTFNWTAPASRVGKITFYVAGNAANSDGTNGGDYIYTSSAATLSGSAPINFDSDERSDIAVFRPSQGIWYSLSSASREFGATRFGLDGDKVVPGDYDADGRTDVAVFRPSNGLWFVFRSSQGLLNVPFGLSGDVPVAGDYDGDLKSDIAVWRPSSGTWFILRSSDGMVDQRQWGLSTDKVAQGDYDGDAKTDIAVWRPSEGMWYVWKSSDNGRVYQQFGTSGDKPTQGDYDGDGRMDFAVFRPSTGIWFLLRSTQGFSALRWGLSTDRLVPSDYDGDGKTDAAVYRDGLWFIFRSSNGTMLVESFGLAGDMPLPAALIAE